MLKSSFIKAEVTKVDEELGLVFGFAIVSKIDDEPYFDVQGDYIPEDAMLRAATDFMLHSRVAKEMHDGEQVGDVVFAFPLTTEIAKAMDIETRKTGLMIAMRPSPDVLAKYRSGEYKGFSVGGLRGVDEDADEVLKENPNHDERGRFADGSGGGGGGESPGPRWESRGEKSRERMLATAEKDVDQLSTRGMSVNDAVARAAANHQVPEAKLHERIRQSNGLSNAEYARVRAGKSL